MKKYELSENPHKHSEICFPSPGNEREHHCSCFLNKENRKFGATKVKAQVSQLIDVVFYLEPCFPLDHHNSFISTN